MPLLSILSGLGLGSLVIIGAIATSVCFGLLLFNVNSPYLVSDIPFRELVNSQYYYFGLISLYFSILLPIIFAFFVSIFLVIRKNVFRLKIFVLLTLIWLIAIVGASVSMVNIFSSAKEKIDTQKAKNQITKELDFNNINKIKISGEARVRVSSGEDFNFKIVGDKDNVERFAYENKTGELIVTQKPEENQYCLFCFDDETEIDISVPNLDSFVAAGKIDARVEDLNKDLQIEVRELARVELEMEGNKLDAYLAGRHSHLVLMNSPEIINVISEGSSSYMKAKKLDAREITIEANNFSSISLGGVAQKLDIKAHNQANIYAKDLEVREAFVNADGSSEVELDPWLLLDVKVAEEAEVSYLQEPPNFKKQEFDNGRVSIFSDSYKQNGVIFIDEDGGKFSFAIDADAYEYGPYMSSIRGIGLSPELDNHADIDLANKTFYWSTNYGALVSDWNNIRKTTEIVNQGEKVYWTFNEEENSSLPEDGVKVKLRVKDNEDKFIGISEINLRSDDGITFVVEE